MPLGPGKYDAALTTARLSCYAQSAILIVLDGLHGPGFSCQATSHELATLPQLLRTLADTIEHDVKSDVTTLTKNPRNDA
jgi:hypothetical protein